ncbi:MAG: tagaturonate epimerase family protein [Chthoniobacteraceae bacterium]
MPLPAPAPLAARPTVALGCTGLHFPTDALRTACENGITPVLMHRLTGEDGSSDDGPREMLAATAAALAKAGHAGAWGAGCTVSNAADAAAFATAGSTWFSFALGREIDSRAESMSLDQLDAAIVALEDSGGLAADWHSHYTDREWQLTSGRTLRLADETLARVAVKYGRALAHAGQLQQVIRTLWTGRGAAPDIELCFAGCRDRWSAEEFLFLVLESARCGLAPVCISPSLGAAWQPGAEFDGDQSELSATLSLAGEIAALAGALKIGIHHASGKANAEAAAQSSLGARAHLDFEEAAWLATLDTLAHQQPELFRRWLCIAQEVFSFAAGGMALTITEEDIHVLPQVDDADLSATFLADVRGRQLLLLTFPDVLRSDRSLREAVSAAR